MKRKIQSLVLATTISLVPHVVLATTLKEVVLHTLQSNPEVLAATANQRAKYYALRQAKGQYLFSVDITAKEGYEYSKNPSVEALGQSDATLWRHESAIIANQPIFKGGQTYYTVKEKKYNLIGSGFDVNNRQEVISLNTVSAYLNVIRTEKIVLLAKSNIQAHLQTLHKIELKFKGGAGRRAEVALAKSRLTQAQARYMTAIGDVKLAKAQYTALTGFAPENLQMPKVPFAELPYDLDRAISSALSGNPALKSQAANEKASLAKVKVARAKLFPELSAEIDASDSNNLDGVEGTNQNAMALLVLHYNLFNGGSDLASLRQARQENIQTSQDAVEVQREIIQNVTEAFTAYQTDLARIQKLKASVHESALVVKDYKTLFMLGQEQLFNVLDAENELFNAKVALMNAQFSRDVHVYQILAIMGILVPDIM